MYHGGVAVSSAACTLGVAERAPGIKRGTGRANAVILCAWVRIRSGETLTPDEVSGFCQGQIAHNKIPRYVEFVDEFPMTVTGKIQKFVMREAVEQRLGLKAAKTA